MKRAIVLFSSLLLLFGVFSLPSLSQVHAAAGTVCLIDPSATSCPSIAASLFGTKGNQLRVAVFLQGSSQINGFDITLLTDHTILAPTGASLNASILPGPQQLLVECLSGRLVRGTVCSSTDTLDTLHFAVVACPGCISSATTGLLFTAAYNVTGSTSNIPLGFQTGCSNTSVSTNVCVSIVNGAVNPLSETAQTATFSTSTTPDFSINGFPNTLTINAGSTATSTLSVTSFNGFSGTVALTSTVSPAGFPASISPTSVTLTANQTISSTITISTSTSTPSGTYSLAVTGTSGTLSHSITITVIVNPVPQSDFSLSANPSSLTVMVGSSGSTTISFTSLSGFSGTVNLAASINPAGPAVSLSPTSITLSPGGTGASIATISTTTSTPTGSYTLTISGMSGAISHTVAIGITVASSSADFTISASPTMLNTPPGSTAASTITITSINGFTGVVSLTLTSSSGLTASLSPSTITNSGTATLTVTASTIGSYTAQVVGTSGSTTHSVTVTVIIVSNQGTVCIVATSSSSCPSSTAIITGSPGVQLRISVFIQASEGLNAFDITIKADHTILQPVRVDFAGTVLLGTPTILLLCTGGKLVSGTSCSVTDTLDTIHIAAVSAVGEPLTNPPTTGLLFTAIYNVTATTSGTSIGFQTGCSSSSVAGTTTCVDIANGSPNSVPEAVQTATLSTSSTPDFVLTSSPSSFNINPGSSATSTLTITSINNFTGTVNLAATISPTGPSATLSTSTVTVSAGGSVMTVVTVVTTNSTATNLYTVTVTGASGSISHSTNFGVDVVPRVAGPLAIDGSAAAGCGHNTDSCSTLFSTHHNNDIIIVFATEGLDLQTSCTFSVSDSAGLSWTGRGMVSGRNDQTTGSNRDQIEEFWAKSASVLTSDNITESISGCASQYGGEYNDVIVFGISGANFNTPFDPNTSLPGTASGFSNTPSAAISTSSSNDLVFGFGQQTSFGTLTAGSGFTSIFSLGPGGVALEYRIASSPISNLSVPFGDDTTWYWEIIADAVQPATASNPLSIDGSANAFCPHNTNSCSASLTTQHTNDIITVYTVEALDLQASCSFSVSDTSNLVWMSRSGVVFGGNNRDQIQEFWARSTGMLSSDVITETILGCASVQYGGEYNGLMAFGITGANFNTPFDPNTSLPGTASGTSTGASVFVSTSNSNDMIIGGIFHGAAQLSAGTGFNIITSNPGAPMAAEFENVNAIVTNFPVSFGDNLTADWVSVGDAIQSASILTPDFSLSSSPSSVTLTTGSSATSTLTATSINSFTGTVTLFATTPAGITSSLNSTSISLSSGGTAVSTLTIASSPSIPAGSYTITVTGTSGNMTHSVTITVTVTRPGDFTISESPTSQSIPSNSEKQTVITITSVNGFSGNVTLVASPSSTAVACWFTTLTNTATVFVPSGGSATQYPTCGAYSPPGSYTVTISGTSRSLSHSVTLPVTVMDYSISAQSVVFNAGSTSTGTLTLTSQFGLSGPVSLAVSTPAGLSASCPSSVTLPSSGTITASCSFSSASGGAYSATVTGTFVCSNCYYNGPDTHPATFTVNVQDFSVSANPTTLSVHKSSQTNSSIAVSTVTLTSLGGFTGPVTVFTSIAPTGPHGPSVTLSTGSLTLSPAGTATLILRVAAGKNTSAGTYTVNVTFTSGSITHTVAITVTVAH